MVMCVGVGGFEGNSGLWVWNYMFIRWVGMFLCCFVFIAIIISLANYSCVFDGITPSY